MKTAVQLASQSITTTTRECVKVGGVAFGGSRGELWECEIARKGRLLDLPHGGTNTDCGSR